MMPPLVELIFEQGAQEAPYLDMWISRQYPTWKNGSYNTSFLWPSNEDWLSLFSKLHPSYRAKARRNETRGQKWSSAAAKNPGKVGWGGFRFRTELRRRRRRRRRREKGEKESEEEIKEISFVDEKQPRSIFRRKLGFIQSLKQEPTFLLMQMFMKVW